MDGPTRYLVRLRANYRCEYCRLHQDFTELTHHVEHIVAKQHGGSDEAGNLGLACHRCNLHKGPNLAGVDPSTQALVPLFHPRRDTWTEHFSIAGARLLGLTPTGRATVHVLAMNDTRRLELREQLMKSGLWP